MRFKDVEFVLGASKKFDSDFQKAKALLEKKRLTRSDRLELLSIYQSSWHDDGKIEDFTSCDSSCNGCRFCDKMREAGKNDPTIICNYCYDAAQEERWITVRNRHGLNLLIMSATDYIEDELRIIKTTKFNRFNSSGETPNDIYARNCFRIANVNPLGHFGYWAKNTTPVQQAIEDLGKPKNTVLIQSSVHIGKPDKLRDGFQYVFTVYPDEASTLAAIASGASPCNGRKCIDCGRKCYIGGHKSENIAELLRVSKKKRAEIMKGV